MGRGRKVFFVFSLRPLPSPFDSPQLVRFLAVEYGELSVQTIGDVSINNEYEYENDFKPVLVLEVVFSAFYVSDDTEFEFIELCRKYRVRLLFLDFKSSILHKT